MIVIVCEISMATLGRTTKAPISIVSVRGSPFTVSNIDLSTFWKLLFSIKNVKNININHRHKLTASSSQASSELYYKHITIVIDAPSVISK